MRNERGQFVRQDMPIKKCVFCHNFYPKNRNYSHKQWNLSKTCSYTCNSALRHLVFRHSEESKEKNRIAHLGKPTKKGENHWNWKGGITPLRKRLYFSEKYQEWRKAVFERDDYTCQICGIRGGELNADHIKQWSIYPELRFDIKNGRTLCVSCHRKTPTWGNRNKSAPTLTTTGSKADMFGFVCTASGAYDGFVVGQNI